ncbi:translation initiation factor 2 subunit 1 [Pancytospora epiphaga]|nr:translation initiation factor 2 subunit 1 [Pancytospora epiphaga]
MFECRIAAQEYPTEGEIVIARTSSTQDNIINMKLVEYGDLPGLVLSGEVSKKRVRSIHQITKSGSIEVCQVLKVDKATGCIDLSLKSVGDTEKRDCLERAGKNKLSYQIMQKTAKLAGVSVSELYKEVGYEKAAEYGSLHAYFVKAREDETALKDTKYGEHFMRVIEEGFKPSSYKVRIDVDVSNSVDGVTAIKAAFRKALERYPGLEIALLRTPTFSITKVSPNKEDGFKEVTDAAEIVKEYIEVNGGTFTIVNPAKVYGERSRYMLLEEQNNGEGTDRSDESDGSDDEDS